MNSYPIYFAGILNSILILIFFTLLNVVLVKGELHDLKMQLDRIEAKENK